jgi:hypothetical protein
MKRTRRLNVLVSDEERKMMQTLAESSGITASDWMRLRIREAFRNLSIKATGQRRR